MNSRYPKHFSDDGTVVTVDVHGCTVRDGLNIVRRTVYEAFQRGRAQVVVIHGRSTSEKTGAVLTIKTELERQLAEGEFSQWVAGTLQSDSGGSSSLWLNLGPKQNRTLISMKDVAGR